jgi:hypothetical protein
MHHEKSSKNGKTTCCKDVLFESANDIVYLQKDVEAVDWHNPLNGDNVNVEMV